jgi:hypothetical protein
MVAAWIMHPLRRKKNSAPHAAFWRVRRIRAIAGERRALLNGERQDQAVADQSGQFFTVSPQVPAGDDELT